MVCRATVQVDCQRLILSIASTALANPTVTSFVGNMSWHIECTGGHLPQCEVQFTQVHAARQVDGGLNAELQGQRAHQRGLVQRKWAAICRHTCRHELEGKVMCLKGV